MIYSNMSDYALINNISLKDYINKNVNISYNKYEFPIIDNQSFIFNQFYQKYFIQNLRNYIFLRNNFQNYYYQPINKENNFLNKNDKEDNFHEKVNTLKFDKKRKTSMDTTISSSSFISTSNEYNEKENIKIKKEEKKINAMSKYNTKKKKYKINAYSKYSENKNNLKKENIDKNMEYEGNPEFENTVILMVNV